eukprot:6425933-Amphidinium_carterae.6
MASAASKVHKRRGQSSSFGFKTKEDQRRRVKQWRFSAWQKSLGQKPFQRALQLAEKEIHINGLMASLSAAKKAQRLDSDFKKQSLLEQERKLRTWMDSEGQKQVKELLAACPQLPFHADELVPVPSTFGVAICCPAIGADAASKAIAFAAKRNNNNLAKSLEKEWQELHLPIGEVPEEVPAIDVPASKCYELGLCVCSESGAQTLKLRNRLHAVLKQAFKLLAARNPLAKAEIALCFCSYQQCQAHESMNFSPYKATVLRMNRARHLENVEDQEHGRIYLEVLSKVNSLSHTQVTFTSNVIPCHRVHELSVTVFGIELGCLYILVLEPSN